MERRTSLRLYGDQPARSAIALAVGGSGGHYYPAVAIAEELARRAPELPVLLVGAQLGRYAPSTPLPPNVTVADLPLRRRGNRGSDKARYVATSARSFPLIRRTLASFARRGVLVSLGGPVSVPVALAARSLGWRIVLVEPNVVPGRAHRQLVMCAELVCVGSSETLSRWNPPCPAAVTGIPVRRAILEAAAGRRNVTRPPGVAKVLATIGGSQGARALNNATLALAEALAERRVWIVHQTGSTDWPRVRHCYGCRELRVLAVPYVAEIDELYRCADVLLMRAGASSIAEAAVCNVPAVLVPYPHAADDHQLANALWAARSMGWRVVVERPGEGPPECALREAVLDLLLRAADRRPRPAFAELHAEAAQRISDQLLRRCA